MGEGTTISLLTSINERLKTIIENTAPQNKSPEQETRENVKTLHKGEFTKQVKVDNTSSEQTRIAPMNMKDIVATLAQMPIAVRTLVGIKDKNLKKFKVTMAAIANSMEEFAKKGEDMKKGGDILEKVAKSFQTFNDLDLSKILKQFQRIDKSKAGEAFGRVLDTLVSGIQNLRKLNDKDFDNLENFSEYFAYKSIFRTSYFDLHCAWRLF